MIEVLKGGLLTTVQDLGRPGYQRYGVVVGGAVDGFAARTANLLAGNEPNAALIEMALIGPELKFAADTLVAWGGADFDAKLGAAPLPKDRPVRVAAGQAVSFGPVKKGAMAWLAVAGGIDVPLLMGSRGTYRRAGVGGHEGRGLIPGDKLKVFPAPALAKERLEALQKSGRTAPTWSIRPEVLGTPPAAGELRAVRGPEWDWFGHKAQAAFFGGTFKVTKDADRMGVRLEGRTLDLAAPREMISSAVNAGVVQVPPGGQPIVLSASRQTIGGYPRIGAVVSVDWGAIAQLKPGDTVRFREVTLAAAHDLLARREKDFQRVQMGLSRLPL
jgi:antagonist of KipI